MESVRMGSQLPPRINLEGQHAGVIKRIRQACSNCRYVTCSGPWGFRTFDILICILDQLALTTRHKPAWILSGY